MSHSGFAFDMSEGTEGSTGGRFINRSTSHSLRRENLFFMSVFKRVQVPPYGSYLSLAALLEPFWKNFLHGGLTDSS